MSWSPVRPRAAWDWARAEVVPGVIRCPAPRGQWALDIGATTESRAADERQRVQRAKVIYDRKRAREQEAKRRAQQELEDAQPVDLTIEGVCAGCGGPAKGQIRVTRKVAEQIQSGRTLVQLNQCPACRPPA